MMTALNKLGISATKDLIVATCVDASFMCMVTLRLDQHQILFRMVADLVESGRVILGRAWQNDWKRNWSDWSWISRREDKWMDMD